MEKYVGKMILIYKYLIFFQRKCVILQGGHTKKRIYSRYFDII